MKKIVPFKKEIIFDDYIYEIMSISLEHTLSLNNNLVTGSFLLSGSYKVTESSLNMDEFNYNLPFEISIDKKYNTDNVILDINDFYYEVIDNKILSLNIEVSIDNLEEKVEVMKSEDRNIIEDTSPSKIEEESNEETFESKKVFEPIEEIEKDNPISSLFDNIDDKENYVTYKVHVVSENDTVDSIIKKYETSLSKLKDYNNISDIKIGDKVIIPTND